MKSLHKFARWVAVLTLAALPAWGLDTKALKPTGYVNDFCRTLDAASKQTLEAYCANLERVTGVQMAIVLVPTLDGEPIEDVANRLYREWGIGKKGKDEGDFDYACGQGSERAAPRSATAWSLSSLTAPPAAFCAKSGRFFGKVTTVERYWLRRSRSVTPSRNRRAWRWTRRPLCVEPDGWFAGLRFHFHSSYWACSSCCGS